MIRTARFSGRLYRLGVGGCLPLGPGEVCLWVQVSASGSRRCLWVQEVSICGSKRCLSVGPGGVCLWVQGVCLWVRGGVYLWVQEVIVCGSRGSASRSGGCLPLGLSYPPFTTHPSCGQTPVETLPCLKLRLRAVTMCFT